MPNESNLLPLEDEQEVDLAHAYLNFNHAESKSPEWHALFWTFYRMGYLAKHLPRKAWRVILLIRSIHQCPRMVGGLSGPIRTMLLKHPFQMLPIIEDEAYRDPSFAELLGTLQQITIADNVYARVVAASEQRQWDGSTDSQLPDDRPCLVVSPELMPREDENDQDLARAYVASQQTEFKSDKWLALFWTHERMNYLTRYLPDKALRVILLIWSMDQSIKTVQSLSAGEIENLLVRHGTEMIALVEAEARRDPTFAKLLGGVWKNRMTDEVWSRLQAVWDRRGWDGISE